MGIDTHRHKWRQHQAVTYPKQAAHQPPAAASRRQDSIDDPMTLASLHNDVERLHGVNSLASKQLIKASELLPRYAVYLDKQMVAGKKPGSVMVRAMIWAFDTDNLDQGMTYACYIQGQGGAVMPDGFKRDFPNYILGTVGDIAAKQVSDNTPVTDHITTINEWMTANPQWDIVDKIKAAVLKGAGGWLEANAATEPAIHCYEQALALDSSVGLKRRINRLRGDPAV